MKSLTKYLYEKLIITKDYKTYSYSPKTPEELREIIIKRYDEHGPGTKNKPIDFNDIDVSGIISFYDTVSCRGIFEATRFEYIDVSEWNISKINNLSFTFAYCTYLKELDISNWDISNVQKSMDMFYSCSHLKRLLIPDFCKIDNNINMTDMFYDCNPKSIPNWYTI